MAVGLEDGFEVGENARAEMAEIGAAVVHGGVVHGAQDAIGHVGGAGDLEEVAAGGAGGLVIGHRGSGSCLAVGCDGSGGVGKGLGGREAEEIAARFPKQLRRVGG